MLPDQQTQKKTGGHPNRTPKKPVQLGLQSVKPLLALLEFCDSCAPTVTYYLIT